MNLVGGHRDATAAPDLVRNFALIERIDHLGSLGLGKVAKENGVVFTARPNRDAAQTEQDDQSGEDDRDSLVDADLLPDGSQLLQEFLETVVHHLGPLILRPASASILGTIRGACCAPRPSTGKRHWLPPWRSWLGAEALPAE